MADSIYTRNIIGNIYSKLNTSSGARCKSRFPDNKSDYQLCFHQSMADNAGILITRLKGQIGACRNTTNPNGCIKKINKLITYLSKKQEEHETHVDQLRDLEEG